MNHLSSPRSKISDEVLNPELWSLLPDDLIEVILTKVEFPTLVRLRTVCKMWNEIILSNYFIPTNGVTRKCVPFHFTLYTPQEGEAFRKENETYFKAHEHRMNDWVELSLSFLKLDPNMGNWEMAVSSGGLLCMTNMRCFTFVVCNPISKNWRLIEFPTSDEYQDCSLKHLLVGLIVNHDTGNYILVIYRILDHVENTTHIYDSKKKSIRIGANTPFITKDDYPSQPGVSCAGALYWISHHSYLDSPKILKYDVEHDLWSSYQLSWYPLNVQILEHKNQPIIITCEGSACVVEESESKWNFKDKCLPNDLVKQMERKGYDFVKNSSWIGAGDLICGVKEVIKTNIIDDDSFELVVDEHSNNTTRDVIEGGIFETRLELFGHDFSENISTIKTDLGYGSICLCWVIQPSLIAIP